MLGLKLNHVSKRGHSRFNSTLTDLPLAIAAISQTMFSNIYYSKSLFANLYMNTLNTLHFTKQISTLNTESRHQPNPVAFNSAGVCQYDITNTTIDYNTASMTTLGPQFKDR